VPARRRKRSRKRGETEKQFLARCKKLDQDAARKEREREQQRIERERVAQTRAQLEREREAATRPAGDSIYVQAFPDGESWAEAGGHLEAIRIADESYEKWQNRFDAFAESVSAHEGARDPWDFVVREPAKSLTADTSKLSHQDLDPSTEETNRANASKSVDDAVRNFLQILAVGPTGETQWGEGVAAPSPSESQPPRPVPANITKIVFHLADLTRPARPLFFDAHRAVLTNTRACERGRSLFASAGCEPVLQLPDPPPLKKARPPRPRSEERSGDVPRMARPEPKAEVPVSWHETVLMAALTRWLRRVRQERPGLVVVRLGVSERLALCNAYASCRRRYSMDWMASASEPLPEDCPAFALFLSLIEEALRMAQDVTGSGGLLSVAQYVQNAEPDAPQLMRCRSTKCRPALVHRAYEQSVRTEIEAGRLAVLTDERKETPDERRAS
jgi:hypothetical protein